MLLKNIIQEDFSNYKTCSMLLGFPSCTWKCERDCDQKGLCQNSELAKSPSIEISLDRIIATYLANPLSSAIVCGGLEPFDSWGDLYNFISEFRKVSEDSVIIYTGYNKEEISEYLPKLEQFRNIIIKFGRFIPGHRRHYDEVLGVSLASMNQYAERIS